MGNPNRIERVMTLAEVNDFARRRGLILVWDRQWLARKQPYPMQITLVLSKARAEMYGPADDKGFMDFLGYLG